MQTTAPEFEYSFPFGALVSSAVVSIEVVEGRSMKNRRLKRSDFMRPAPNGFSASGFKNLSFMICFREASANPQSKYRREVNHFTLTHCSVCGKYGA
jgi:hypothetical protein